MPCWQYARFKLQGCTMTRSTAPDFDLVIFDCDGVLVDSEMLSAEVLMALLSENGIVIDAEIFHADFLGRSFASALQRLNARTGQTVPADFAEQYSARLLPTFEARLQPMPDIFAVLEHMLVPFCVASSSKPKRLATSLNCTKLAPFFAPNVFSGASVKNAKPAPDLFFHAAEKMRVKPQRCLVIEDSDMGLQAAKAAGMAVWHFCGGSHMKGSPGAAGVTRIDDMRQLLDMFVAAGLCATAEKEK
jgi:HAD superfamily hydrolase (TIGR01509 family)